MLRAEPTPASTRACLIQWWRVASNSPRHPASQPTRLHYSNGASGSSHVRNKCSFLAAFGPTLRPVSVFMAAMDWQACCESTAYCCAIDPNVCSFCATEHACFGPQSRAHNVLAQVFCFSVRLYAAAVPSSLSPLFFVKAASTSGPPWTRGRFRMIKQTILCCASVQEVGDLRAPCMLASRSLL